MYKKQIEKKIAIIIALFYNYFEEDDSVILSYQSNMMNDKKYNGRVTVMALSTAKVSRRRERALMRFEGKLAGTERSKLQKLGRVSSVNITSIRVWRCGTSTGGRSGKQGWCRLLSRGTPEPRSPLHVDLDPSREKVYENEHALSVVGVATKLHDLGVLSVPKLFPANRKNSPMSPPPLRKTPSVFCIATFPRLTRHATHCFDRITSILNCH